jgi:L-ascorbate metabolism protein UlaG (beta-lactamase superfamily)
VLVSHNHYEHLDLPTLRRLSARGSSTFIVPARQADLFRSQKIGPVQELDWGDSIALKDLRIHCVPAMHFSSRSMFDRNRTLWCGYVIETADRIVYFAGDTAFGNHFGWIRERFGVPELALLPIGAYEPRWFMARVHLAPDEAIRAHKILGARISVAIHHGTFQLTDESIDTPREQLVRCGKPDSFLILRNGESIDLLE